MKSFLAAALASALACSVTIAGAVWVDRFPPHPFLAWNLALAWVPFLAAVGVAALIRRRHTVAALPLGAAFLAFLPNAPYLMTDLIHFDRTDTATPWLDLSELLAFAFAGLVLGVLALREIAAAIEERWGAVPAHGAAALAAGASGFGITLGRFGRLNSWELVTDPTGVALGARSFAFDPRALAVGAFFGALLLVAYAAVVATRTMRL